MKESIGIPEASEQDLLQVFIRHSARRERSLIAERDRAVEAAVALENEVARLNAENEIFREIIKNLRWRIFALKAYFEKGKFLFPQSYTVQRILNAAGEEETKK
jgi:cell division protein FtsB